MIKVTVTDEGGKVLNETSGEYIVGTVATHKIEEYSVSTKLGVLLAGDVSGQMFHDVIAKTAIQTAKEVAKGDNLEAAVILKKISAELRREVKRLIAEPDKFDPRELFR